MEMMDVMYELATSKSALEMAGSQIRKLKGKCFRKNVAIVGLVWLSMTACKLLGESDSKRKEAEKRAREAEVAYAELDAKLKPKSGDFMEDKTVWCDGKVTLTDKPV